MKPGFQSLTYKRTVTCVASTILEPQRLGWSSSLMRPDSDGDIWEEESTEVGRAGDRNPDKYEEIQEEGSHDRTQSL